MGKTMWSVAHYVLFCILGRLPRWTLHSELGFPSLVVVVVFSRWVMSWLLGFWWTTCLLATLMPILQPPKRKLPLTSPLPPCSAESRARPSPFPWPTLFSKPLCLTFPGHDLIWKEVQTYDISLLQSIMARLTLFQNCLFYPTNCYLEGLLNIG